ncbi:MAG: DUF4261 domain-containing protein [Hyphomicrobiales bacterium]
MASTPAEAAAAAPVVREPDARSTPGTSHFLSYVALAEHARVTAEETVASCRSIGGDGLFDISVLPPTEELGDDNFALRVNGATIVVIFADMALPPDSWEEAAVRSITFNDAAKVMVNTRAHVIVALVEPPTDHIRALNGAAAVTLVLAGLSAILPAAAVVFTEAQSIVRGAALVGQARQLVAGQVPVTLWTTMTLARGAPTEGGLATVMGSTLGLRAFIGREIEFLPAPMPPMDLARRLIGMASYLCAKGPIIADGETIAVSDTEKIAVQYADEGSRPGIPVLLMRFVSGGGSA